MPGAFVFGGDPCWTRTNDNLLRRQVLYPAELRGRFLYLSVSRAACGCT